MLIKTIGSTKFELKEDFDFSFLQDYGDPFVVFDKQDSGNLCFGVQRGGRKLFLKIAGAPTVESQVSPSAAVERLLSTIPIYEDLRHPSLTPLLAHTQISGGYLVVFEWFDGVCMGKQYRQFQRFLDLPLDEKLGIYRTVLEFHEHVNSRGYIAIDFYDGSILYNFSTRQTMICDIEFYRKMPVRNELGRMWGSNRYMSPEEFELGSEIDERSNVFCMGATAFQLMGGGMDRSIEKWNAPAGLHRVALKAVSADKADRYQSISEYRQAWMATLSCSSAPHTAGSTPPQRH